MKLLVLGPAISGTFLTTRLMSYFDESLIEEDKHPKTYFQGVNIKRFVLEPDVKNKMIWRKGNERMLFNGVVGKHKADEQYEFIKYHNIRVVATIRDIYDAIVSKPLPHVCKLWVNAVKNYFDYNDVITVSIKYEDLVKNPDDIQRMVAEKLGLTIKHKWSEYPKYLPEAVDYGTMPHHKVRPIDQRSVNKNNRLTEERLRYVCQKCYKDMLELRQRLGYD